MSNSAPTSVQRGANRAKIFQPGEMHTISGAQRVHLLDRALEALPSRKAVADRLERREGLSVPELAVLFAYTKIVLSDELLKTDVAEDPFLRGDLFAYFPQRMRQTYRERMESHPLRREIIVTSVVNDLVNGAGITFFHRLSEETGATAEDLVRANFVAREVFGSRALVDEITSYDNQVDAAVQTRMRLEMRTLVERASRWLVNNRRPPLDERLWSSSACPTTWPGPWRCCLRRTPC